MDEVDKIIIHSLNQIGCSLETEEENNIFGLNHFSPDLLVRAVARCLQEINPDIVLPKSLSDNMAQRFAVATALAEMCSSCGYRGDIGYQTFLYPNVVDIRRLFMFLIEQFPKEQIDHLISTEGTEERDATKLLMKEIKLKISKKLKSPWVPQYCRGIANSKLEGSSSLTVDFLPQLNLHIPQLDNESQLKELSYQVPNIFQQSSSGEYDLVSSVLHKCAIDLYSSPPSLEGYRVTDRSISHTNLYPTGRSLQNIDGVASEEMHKENDVALTQLKIIANEVDSLTFENDVLKKELQIANKDLNELRQKRSHFEEKINIIKAQTKFHERTCVILDNPLENVDKLLCLIDKTRERRLTVENQWMLHREPALRQINDLKKLRQTKNGHNIQELQSMIQGLETHLREKTNRHAQLAEELKKSTLAVANRKEYTMRIYEFISNIRKQRNDIFKILDDTRDLQKQLNSVSAQLQRQFNYTDDLLFQSAKHDLHAKQAYKLLASLHSSCNEICELVSRAGQMAKDARDLEVQIDREYMRNVVASLEKITTDIKQFEMMIKSMQADINVIENEIQPV